MQQRSRQEKTCAGSAAGVGAHYAWESDKRVGQGEIGIHPALPPPKLGCGSGIAHARQWDVLFFTFFSRCCGAIFSSFSYY